MPFRFLAIILSSVLLLPSNVVAEEPARPVMDFPSGGIWKQSFDTTDGAAGKVNAELRAAQFVYSMLEDEGVPRESIQVAIVVHGTATFDFLTDARYREKYGDIENPNIPLVKAFLESGGEIWMSGFGLTFRKIEPEDLLPGVGVAPAGLIAHAELNRRGFMLNPFHTD